MQRRRRLLLTACAVSSRGMPSVLRQASGQLVGSPALGDGGIDRNSYDIDSIDIDIDQKKTLRGSPTDIGIPTYPLDSGSLPARGLLCALLAK